MQATEGGSGPVTQAEPDSKAAASAGRSSRTGDAGFMTLKSRGMAAGLATLTERATGRALGDGAGSRYQRRPVAVTLSYGSSRAIGAAPARDQRRRHHMTSPNLNWIANHIWGIADDVLRDVYVRGKYHDVILPMTVLRRLDAVLAPTKQTVLDMKTSGFTGR